MICHAKDKARMYFKLIMHEVSKIDALKKSMTALNEEKRFTTKFNGSRYLRYKTNQLIKSTYQKNVLFPTLYPIFIIF